jgi:hypothetical protein
MALRVISNTMEIFRNAVQTIKNNGISESAPRNSASMIGFMPSRIIIKYQASDLHAQASIHVYQLTVGDHPLFMAQRRCARRHARDIHHGTGRQPAERFEAQLHFATPYGQRQGHAGQGRWRLRRSVLREGVVWLRRIEPFLLVVVRFLGRQLIIIVELVQRFFILQFIAHEWSLLRESA